MKDSYSLRIFLTKAESVMVLLIHYLYMLALFLLLYDGTGMVFAKFHGILYLSGLYMLCIIRHRFLRSLPLIFSGFLVLLTLNCLFLSIAGAADSIIFLCSVVMLGWFLAMDIVGYRKKTDHFSYRMRWYFIAEPVLMYIYGAYSGHFAFQITALFLTISWILIQFICAYLKGISRFLDINRDIEGVPRTAIFKSSANSLFTILGVMAVILLLCVLAGYDEVFSAVALLVLRIIGTIIKAVMTVFSWIAGLFGTGGLTGTGQNPDLFSAITRSRWFILWEIIGNLIFWFVVFVFIRNGIRYFYRRIEKQDTVEKREIIYDEPERQTEDIAVMPKRRRLFFQKKNRIRYLFYKEVRRIYRDDVPKGKTSHELLDQNEKNKNLATSYDAARYGRNDLDI